MAKGSRTVLIDYLTRVILERRGERTLRVGFDGIDAAGKTTLADEMKTALEAAGVPVLRASMDGFHRPATERRRREAESPALSYYEDSFDYAALRSQLLDPLATQATPAVRSRVFDFREDRPVDDGRRRVGAGTVLLFDGVLLQRPELEGCWDLVVFLCVDPRTSLTRALERDLPLFGERRVIVERYRNRYLAGQRIYLEQTTPEERADMGSTTARRRVR